MSPALKVMTFASVVATIAALVSLWFGYAEYTSGEDTLFEWLGFPIVIVSMVWLLRYGVMKKVKAEENA